MRAAVALLACAAVCTGSAFADCRHHAPPKADAFPWEDRAAEQPSEKKAPEAPCRGPDCVNDSPDPAPAPAPPGPPPSPQADAILATPAAPVAAHRMVLPPLAVADPLTLSNPVYRPPRLS